VIEPRSAVAVRPVRRGAYGRRGAYVVSRFKKSAVLRGTAMLSFLEYGALAMLAVLGATLRPNVWKDGANFHLAGWMAFCSLASWFFLFAWFPFLETLESSDRGDGAATLGRVLEKLAIGAVVVVHATMALILARALGVV
jgi:hypothetical protein